MNQMPFISSGQLWLVAPEPMYRCMHSHYEDHHIFKMGCPIPGMTTFIWSLESGTIQLWTCVWSITVIMMFYLKHMASETLLLCYYLKGHSETRSTLWGRDEIDAILQTTVSRTFSWMKIYRFQIKFHWGLFPRVQLPIFQHWFR